MTPTKQTPYCSYCEKEKCGCNLMEEYIDDQKSNGHTKTPWQKYHRKGLRLSFIKEPNYSDLFTGVNGKENFEYALKAINNHDKLVEALKIALEDLKDNPQDYAHSISVCEQTLKLEK